MNRERMWLRRPRAGEDDDDVLHQRDEFLAAKCNPAATCINAPVDKTQRQPKTGNKSEPSLEEGSSSSSSAQVPVLLDIVERDVVHMPVPTLPPICVPNGFPVPSRRPVGISSKKTSIFLQQMNKIEQKSCIPNTSASSAESSSAYPETSCSRIIDGSGLGLEHGHIEAKKVHEENLQKIASLSNDEIIQLRKELLKNLGSDKISFLQSKRKSSLGTKNADLKKTSSSHDSINRTTSSQSHLQKQINLSGDPLEKVIKDSSDFDRDAIIFRNLPPEVDAAPHEKVAAEPDVPLEELPINPEEAGHWLNMNRVEKDKLAWMTLLPKVESSDENANYVARFDFEGNLLPHNVEIPTQRGLHHHSNEPEVAGYSVEELFLLARSSFQSQRITALETLAHILENYWNGRFDGCFSTNLLTSLLEAGLAPLLRWALDDNTVSSIAAAVLCIHRLLINKCDEMCLDWTYCWQFGHISPFLAVKCVEPSENLDELTDANIIKMDVITGFLRMDILARFRYILRVLCPTSSVCKLIIEICTRISRHSFDSAKQVIEFSGLLEAIIIKFLPVSWQYHPQNSNTLNAYYPMFSAVKLIRVIASADKQLALQLIEHHNVKDFLMCYLAIDPSDRKLPPVEVQKLMVESLKLWHTLLLYGFCTDVYIDLLPLLLRHFSFFQTLSINTNLESNIANYEYAAHFLKVLQAVITAAASRGHDHSGTSSKLANGLHMSDVVNLAKMCELCLQKWLYEFSIGPTNHKGQVLLASCINFMTLFCTQSVLEDGCAKAVLSMFNSIFGCNFQRFIASEEFTALFSNLNSSSILLYEGFSGSLRDSNVLPSLGSILWKDDIVPLLKDGSPFPLLTAVANFLAAAALFDGHLAEMVAKLLPRFPIYDYIESITNLKKPFNHWFASFEICFISDVMDLYRMMGIIKEFYSEKIVTRDMQYKTAMKVALCISTPFEWLLRKTFENILFCPSFLCTSEEMLDDCAQSEQLPGMCWLYVNLFMSHSVLDESKCIFHHWLINRTCSFQINKTCIPDAFWPLVPIIKYYKGSKNNTLAEDVAKLQLNVSHCLRWIHYTHAQKHLSTIKDIPLSVRFAHLCLVFLIDEEIFKEGSISKPLSLCLKDIISTNSIIDLVGMKWEDMPTFEEIFAELLVQYEAVSFGDELFGNFLAFPLQQQYPASWKMMLYSGHERILFFSSVPLHKIIIPVENFLYPIETDSTVLKKYFQGLISGELNHKRSPLFFLMAVHHLHNFVHDTRQEKSKFYKILVRKFSQNKAQKFISYIWNYSGPNPNCELGFSLKDSDMQEFPNQ